MLDFSKLIFPSFPTFPNANRRGITFKVLDFSKLIFPSFRLFRNANRRGIKFKIFFFMQQKNVKIYSVSLNLRLRLTNPTATTGALPDEVLGWQGCGGPGHT